MILVLSSGTVTSDCCGDEGLLLVVRVEVDAEVLEVVGLG